MTDILTWLFWMIVLTVAVIFFRTLFRKPPGSNTKRWVTLSTPELLKRAFQTTEMYGISERTARRHLDMTGGKQDLLAMYDGIFEALEHTPTSDGYDIGGGVKDLGNDVISLTFDLEDDVGNRERLVFEVSCIHLLRITDVLSPVLLGRLDWHKGRNSSEG